MLRVFEQKEKVGMVGKQLAGSSVMITWGRLFFKEILAITDKVFFIALSKEKLGNGVRLRQCCLASRERFLEFDGFDEVFLNGCEDIDLCLRMSEGGLIHFVVHDSVVDHVRAALKGENSQPKKY